MRMYDPVAGMWLSYDSVWNDRDPNYLTFAGGDPIMGFDSDGRCVKATGNFYYNGGPAGYLLNGIGNALNGYSGDNAAVGAYGSYLGTLFNEVGGAVSPSTYVNGLSSYGHNVGSYYQDSGVWAAGSYALTSWNVGAVYSGAANFDLQYDTAGQSIGDGFQRGAVFSGGVASTAMIASGGLGAYNWLTTPETTATTAPGFVDRALTEPDQGWVRQLEQQQQVGPGSEGTGPLVEPLPDGTLRIQLPKAPLDDFPYPQHPSSTVLGPDVDPGTYVYVRDVDGTVYIADNGPHMHPQVLGGAQPAIGAGEITIGSDGMVTEINNESGTFRFTGQSLPGVEQAVKNQGLTVSPGAVKPTTRF
jgi:hypothetical protein